MFSLFLHLLTLDLRLIIIEDLNLLLLMLEPLSFRSLLLHLDLSVYLAHCHCVVPCLDLSLLPSPCEGLAHLLLPYISLRLRPVPHLSLVSLLVLFLLPQ